MNTCDELCNMYITVNSHTHTHTHTLTHTHTAIQVVAILTPLYVNIYISLVSRERELFYLTTHSTHFIYGYMASDIWFLPMKDRSDEPSHHERTLYL